MLASSPGHLEGEEKKRPVHTVCASVKYFRIPFIYVPVNSYNCHVFNIHTLLLGVYVESAPIAHYEIV